MLAQLCWRCHYPLTIISVMKHLPLTTIAAVVLVGCGPSVDIHQAVNDGNIEAVKQHLDAGTDVNAKDDGLTPLHEAITVIFA